MVSRLNWQALCVAQAENWVASRGYRGEKRLRVRSREKTRALEARASVDSEEGATRKCHHAFTVPHFVKSGQQLSSGSAFITGSVVISGEEAYGRGC